MTRGSEKFKIRQTPGLGYRLLRAYADKAFLASYSRIQYVGLENIPENCALIFAPNHTNGLMDPLVAMSLGKPLAPMIFAARADMFRIPLLREILLSLYVTPVMRVRDGFSHLEENVGIMDAVSDRLCDGIPYCIMAEGTQRDKHSLLPLRKGIFRVALMADDKLSGRMPVVIVPVGIEYGSYYRYRTSMLVNVGKPMNVSEFRKSNKDLTQPALMNAMRDELTSKMKALYLSLDDDADYDGVLEVCRIVSEDRLLSAGRSAGLPGSRLKNAVVDGKFSLYDRMREDCLVAGTLYALRDSGDVAKQMEYSELVRLGKEAADRRARAHISAASYAGAVDSRLGFMNCRALSGVRRTAVMVLTFPYWLFSVAVTSPVLLAAELLCRVQEDHAFFISLRYAVAAFALPLLWCIYAAVLFTQLPGHLWWLCSLLLLLFCPAYTFAHDWFKAARLSVSDIRFRRDRQLRDIAAEVRRCWRKLEADVIDSSFASAKHLF